MDGSSSVTSSVTFLDSETHTVGQLHLLSNKTGADSCLWAVGHLGKPFKHTMPQFRCLENAAKSISRLGCEGQIRDDGHRMNRPCESPSPFLNSTPCPQVSGLQHTAKGASSITHPQETFSLFIFLPSQHPVVLGNPQCRKAWQGTPLPDSLSLGLDVQVF